jgi:hypothetical protein
MNTTVNEIDHIKEMLSMLPETALHELRTFVDYLADRERRRKELEECVLKAEKEPPIRFESVEDAVKAVFNETKA